MIVLAIESTCDETGASVVRNTDSGVEVLSNVVASSAEIHTKYGGVVPEVAAREQITSILPVIEECITVARVSREEIDAIAVAVGPGLIGSLIIGVETAKALALAWGKPLITVNHMVGHVMANFIRPSDKFQVSSFKWKPPVLPAIALVVSGGHTDLVLIKTIDDWEWIGGTRDDAAGECFDKTARLLGLGYPGGPAIERAAAAALPVASSKYYVSSIKLPRPMIHVDSLEMSFSGLKSALQTKMSDLRSQALDTEEIRNLLAKEVSEAVVEILVNKTMKAVESFSPKSVILAGGVAANSRLREDLRSKIQDLGITFYVPEMRYCGDNAAMIGAAAILVAGSSYPVFSREQVLKTRPDPGLETV